MLLYSAKRQAGTYAWTCTCMDKRLNITWHVGSKNLIFKQLKSKNLLKIIH